jgi:branched-chain amino acid transport system substrate-binding protein
MGYREVVGRVPVAVLASFLLGVACAGTQPKDVAPPETGRTSPTTVPVPATVPGGTGAPAPTPSGPPAPGSAALSRSSVRPVTVPSHPRSPSPVPGARSVPGGPGTPAGAPGGNPGATDVGVTGDTIKLGGFYAESGPAGVLGITALKAAKAVFDTVNAQGGLYGRRIELVSCDTSSASGDRAAACFTKLTQEDKVFALAAGGDGPAMVTAAPLMCKEQVLGLWMDGLASASLRCPHVFPAGPPAPSQAHVVVDHYAATKKPSTAGILAQNDDVGTEWAAGAKKVLAKHGVRVVSEQRYELGEDNLAAQVTNMRLANPDFVFFASEPLGAIAFQLQARAQGWTPPLPAAGVTCAAEIWPREVGASSKGTICARPWVEDAPERAIYEQGYKRYWNDWEKRTTATEVHWVAAKAVVETLRAAGPNLTRKRVFDLLRGGALNGYDTGFGVKFAQRSTPTGNVFTTAVAVVEITEPSGNPSYYTLRQKPAPDPHFEM